MKHETLEPFVNAWALIGLKDYHAATRISADWELALGEGYLLTPCRPPGPAVKRLDDGHLPVVSSELPAVDGVVLTCTAFAVPLPGEPFDGLRGGPDNYRNFVRITARNVSREARQVELPIGVAQQLAPSVTVHPELTLIASEDGVNVATADGVVLRVVAPHASVVPAPGGLAVGAGLAPDATMTVDLVAPQRPLADAAPLRGDDLEGCHEAVLAFWRDLLARAAQLEVPDRKAVDAWRASLIYTLITRERGEPQPGQGFFDEFYVRDAAFITYALDVAGLGEDARAGLSAFRRCQTSDGAVMSQRGQFDGTGQALWALSSHCRLWADPDLLRELLPTLRSAGGWIRSMRHADGRPDGAYAGLLPNSLADGESLWGGEYHIVGYDLWALHGLEALADANEWLGETDEATSWRTEHDEYRARVLSELADRGWRRLPPSYEGEGTDFLNLGMTFPTEVVDPQSDLVRETLDHAEEAFHDGVIVWGGRAEGVGLRAVHPYLTSFVTQGRLARGERDAVARQLAAQLAHTTSTHGYPEGIWVDHGVAWLDAVPHVFGAATYVGLLRRMLIYERDDRLHLLRGVPAAWLAPGERLRLAGAPTLFGQFDLEAVVDGETVAVTVAGEARQPFVAHLDLPDGYQPNEAALNGRRLAPETSVQLPAGDIRLRWVVSAPAPG